MTASRVAGLTGASALLTWASGWWAVLVIALLAGARWPRDDTARMASASAVLAWGGWLVVDALGGALGAVSHVVGRVFGAPALAMLALTLLFIAAGAWSAATIGVALGRRLSGARPIQRVEAAGPERR